MGEIITVITELKKLGAVTALVVIGYFLLKSAINRVWVLGWTYDECKKANAELKAEIAELKKENLRWQQVHLDASKHNETLNEMFRDVLKQLGK